MPQNQIPRIHINNTQPNTVPVTTIRDSGQFGAIKKSKKNEKIKIMAFRGSSELHFFSRHGNSVTFIYSNVLILPEVFTWP